jgi:hypothetical protein
MRALTVKRTMIACAFIVLAAAVLVPVAAGGQIQANVVSWAPNDVQPRKPVTVVFRLYRIGASPYPKDGKPVTGVTGVAVVIRKHRQERRFAAARVGPGRYRTKLVFPRKGGWDLRVRYRATGDRRARAHQVLLGKGAICVGADFCPG